MKVNKTRCIQGRINHKADWAKCPEPTKKKGPTKAKMRKKGAYENQKWGKRGLQRSKWRQYTLKHFLLLKKILKVPGAYESLNPDLGVLEHKKVLFDGRRKVKLIIMHYETELLFCHNPVVVKKRAAEWLWLRHIALMGHSNNKWHFFKTVPHLKFNFST